MLAAVAGEVEIGADARRFLGDGRELVQKHGRGGWRKRGRRVRRHVCCAGGPRRKSRDAASRTDWFMARASRLP
jgi:hypothetical protein